MSSLRSTRSPGLSVRLTRRPGVTLDDLSKDAVINFDSVLFPLAQSPDRTYRLNVGGNLGLAVYEWGPEDGPPLPLIHGGFDFGRTFDVFAGFLARAGWRVVTWDHRNHGDSDRSPMTSSMADTRDAALVISSLGDAPMPVIGHSKGGTMGLRLAEAGPHRLSHVINIDGIPSRRNAPDTAETERVRMLGADIRSWLDRRHAGADGQRKPGGFQELAKRRSQMNPRLSHEWLCYLVSNGAEPSADGWRWKIDPQLRMGGFGPYRPEWTMESMLTLGVPFLGILSGVDEMMGWGTRPEHVVPFLPATGHLEVFEECGHFVHIEAPEETANLILDFLAAYGAKP